MLLEAEIRGIRPIIMHSGDGLDPRHPANLEKAELTRKRGSNRTESDEARIAELECLISLWLDSSSNPTIPAAALRAVIETGARKLKQGPQVREGLIVSSVDEFSYDIGKYGTTVEDLGKEHPVQDGRGRAEAAHPSH